MVLALPALSRLLPFQPSHQASLTARRALRSGSGTCWRQSAPPPRQGFAALGAGWQCRHPCQLNWLTSFQQHALFPAPIPKPQRGTNSSGSSDGQLSDGQLNEMLARSEGEVELFEAEDARMQVRTVVCLLSRDRSSLKGWGIRRKGCDESMDIAFMLTPQAWVHVVLLTDRRGGGMARQPGACCRRCCRSRHTLQPAGLRGGCGTAGGPGAAAAAA